MNALLATPELRFHPRRAMLGVCAREECGKSGVFQGWERTEVGRGALDEWGEKAEVPSWLGPAEEGRVGS